MINFSRGADEVKNLGRLQYTRRDHKGILRASEFVSIAVSERCKHTFWYIRTVFSIWKKLT